MLNKSELKSLNFFVFLFYYIITNLYSKESKEYREIRKDLK
jgi:hypothetical protein